MTAFIESFATQQLMPPWISKGAKSWMFAVEFDAARATAYLDNYFNGFYPDRAPFEYSPLPGQQYGLLCATHHPDISCLKQAQWDTLSHTEVYWSYPVLRRTITEDRLMVDPTVVWVEPFMLDDNPSVVFSSREIWGSDASLATIVREEGPAPHQLHLDVGLDAVKKFSPRSVYERLAVLHIKAEGGQRITDAAQFGQSRPDLAQLVSILGASAQFAGSQTGGSTGDTLLNNLKQIRDAFDLRAAIYRAIVESHSTRTEVDNLVVYEGAEVELDFMWSDSLAEMLTEVFGIKAPTATGPPSDHSAKGRAGAGHMAWDLDRARLPVVFGFSFSSNVTYEVVRTLHTYGV
jgi:hypothetical protein